MKKKSMLTISRDVDGSVVLLKMDNEAYSYVRDLETKLAREVLNNKKLQSELDLIKPVLGTKDLEPAVSYRCRECKFVVKSNWDNSILGCVKNAVCDDFCRMEEN